MSNENQIKNPELIQITAPTIGEAGYADGLNKTFENIDANFATLSNYDFIKGESGTSVNIKETPFYINDPDNAEKKKLSYYGQLLKDYITSLETNGDQSDVLLADGTVLNIFDNFTEDTAGSIYMVYNTENDFTTASTPVSSLYYVFLDGRYAPKNAKIAEEAAYDTLGLKDFSCIVVYDGSLTDENGYVTGGFKSLQNAFPTIYFEQGVGLCWKINGSHTGLPVKGIPGKDGSNATLYIVQADEIIESEQVGISTECEISGIYESYDGYIPINDYGDVSHLNNQSALILTKDPNSDKNLFYFGKLGLKDKEITDGEETKIVKTLYGYCTPSTSINVAIDNEAFINSMKSINILSKGETADSGVKGLFIPLNHNSEGEQKVHLLSATSIANVEGKTNDLKTDVLFTAINDIDSLAVDGEDKDKQLQIDKYMYVKINKDAFDFYASINDINYGVPAAEGYLKYKLKDIITDVDSPFLDTDAVGGARHYGFINGASNAFETSLGIKKIQLTENNTRFVNSDGTVVADHWASMPESFRSRLRLIGDTHNVAGIYRWELESKSDAWDIDELKAVDTDNYSFDSKFKTIFTTTVSPGTSVEFMWFNGMQLANNYDETQYDEDINGVSTRLYVIRGWEASNEFFNFIKFVPIYLNKFNIDEDTALNLNYNVNITGDTNDSKRSITVHGDVNCDNINVYRLTATGAIEHIYTPNDIVSDGGLTLGKITVDDEDKPSCVITADGIVNAQSANFKNDVNSDVAIIDTIYNNALNTLDINLDASSEAYMHINKYQPNILNSASISIEADLMGVDNIDISPIKKTINTVNDVPAITTSMPSSYTNNANIVVSNQSTNSKELYITNTLKDVKISDALTFESGSGVDTTNTSFDSAKNFNMHRLSLNAETSYGSSQQVDAKDSVSLPTNIDKKFVVDAERGYGYTRFDAENSNNINISTSNYIQKISIKKPDNSIVNTTNNLKIIFKDEFICHIGLRGRNRGGSWPVLNSDSQLQLKVYYAIGNNTIKELYTDTKIYKFDYSTTSILYDTNCKWKGWNENGVWLGNNDNDNWRYCAFTFRPYDINIPSSVCNDIFTALNNNNTVYIYVVPYFKLAAHALRNWWQDRRDSLAGICATCPRVLKTNTSRSASTTITKIDTNLPLTEARSEKNNGYVTYYINKLIELDNGVSSTTICDDGIVMRSGQYVFGLGYTQNAVDHRVNKYYNIGGTDPSWKVSDSAENNYISKPILFYHKYDARYYNGKEPYTKDKSNKGYAKRMHAIPLEDIFEAIRYIRESTSTYGL